MLTKKPYLKRPGSNLLYKFSLCISLSLVYALCSQFIIPLPYNLVPVSIQPLPIFLATLIFGWPAVSAYILYLVQGALGAPIFAWSLGGLARLFGPTGGFLFGFALAALFLVLVRNYKKESWQTTLLKVEAANIITFACGLTQLALFVPADKVLSLGLYPFIIGDFVIKAGILTTLLHVKKAKRIDAKK